MSSGGTTDRSEREAWLRRLVEAVALPEAHAERVALEGELSDRGGWALARWDALVAEGRAWQAALEEATPPEGLQGRLAAIADQHAPATGLGRVRPRHWAWAAAALLLVAVGLYALLSSRGEDPGRRIEDQDRRVYEVALLALNDHLDTHERRGDFGLPADMPQRIVHPEGEAARGRLLDVLFFGRGDFVWVVVADDAEDLRRVRKAIARS